MAVTRGKRTRKAASAPANKREQQHRARAKRKRNRRIWQTVLAVATVGGLAALLLLALLQPRPGEYVPSQGNAHVTEGQIGQFWQTTGGAPVCRMAHGVLVVLNASISMTTVLFPPSCSSQGPRPGLLAVRCLLEYNVSARRVGISRQ
jgi:hypothetical protein